MTGVQTCALPISDPRKLDDLYKELTTGMSERQQLQSKKNAVISMIASQRADYQAIILKESGIPENDYKTYVAGSVKERSLMQSVKNYGLAIGYSIPATANFLINLTKATLNVGALWRGLRHQNMDEYTKNFEDITKSKAQYAFSLNSAVALRGTMARFSTTAAGLVCAPVDLPFLKSFNVDKLNKDAIRPNTIL